MRNNIYKIEVLISIDYSGKILSAREIYINPELNNEDIFPMGIRRDIIKMAREGNSEKNYKYTVEYFNNLRTFHLEILHVYDWKIDVLVSEFRLGERGKCDNPA